MEKFKGSQGKWKISWGNAINGIQADEEGQIAVLHGKNREANSKLIAAAPDLLEALQELMCIVDIHSKGTKNNFAWAEYEMAEEAVNKALS